MKIVGGRLEEQVVLLVGSMKLSRSLMRIFFRFVCMRHLAKPRLVQEGLDPK